MKVGVEKSVAVKENLYIIETLFLSGWAATPLGGRLKIDLVDSGGSKNVFARLGGGSTAAQPYEK